MLNYIKDNSKIITKLILNQVGAAILGITLTSAAVTNDTLFVWLSVFSTFFYMCLLYSAIWEEGGKERIRIDGGRAPWKPWRGLWVSLIANIPNFVLAVLIFIGHIFGVKDGAFAFEWAGSINVICRSIATFFEGMYTGLVRSYSPYNPIGYFLIIIPAVIVCTVGYLLGVNNIRVVDVLSGKYFREKKNSK